MIKALSKKKQDGALNEIKVKMVNKILQKVKTILKDDPSLEFLDLLDEVSLTNSDAVLIITQFMAGMQQYKDKYFKYNRSVGKSVWHTSD
ncbi:MAG: hypothetical protein IPI10_19295 [Bacteroidetes bacterium]|nr:hypothetical protein [Bacteroidota bacterium]